MCRYFLGVWIWPICVWETCWSAPGAISREQLEQALELQKGTKQRLGDVLIQNGFITEKSLIDALKIQLALNLLT